MARSIEHPGEVCDEASGRSFIVDGVSHGAVSMPEWRALARALVKAKNGSAWTQAGLVVEVGTLGGKTTRGILELLGCFGWKGVDVLTIDKEKRCIGVLDGFRLNPKTLNGLRFFHGTAPQYFSQFGDPGDWRPVRFAFIDGCHCEDCCRRDIEAIVPFTMAGSVLAFHDAANQRKLGMNVHERYHGDGVDRLYGVTEAILKEVNGLLSTFGLVERVPPVDRGKGAPTPIMGGLEVWQRLRG